MGIAEKSFIMMNIYNDLLKTVYEITRLAIFFLKRKNVSKLTKVRENSFGSVCCSLLVVMNFERNKTACAGACVEQQY